MKRGHFTDSMEDRFITALAELGGIATKRDICDKVRYWSPRTTGLFRRLVDRGAIFRVRRGEYTLAANDAKDRVNVAAERAPMGIVYGQ